MKSSAPIGTGPSGRKLKVSLGKTQTRRMTESTQDLRVTP